MPREGLPTLAELHARHKKLITQLAQQGVTEKMLQQVWMLGASAVVLNLLRFLQGDAPETDPDDPVAKILEAWDAEVLQQVVRDIPKPDA